MTVISVVNVRNSFEPPGQRCADLIFADEPLPPRLRASRKIEGAVLGEEFHNRIEVVSIECVKNSPQRLGGDGFIYRHTTPTLFNLTILSFPFRTRRSDRLTRRHTADYHCENDLGIVPFRRFIRA
jgi:hypothetical protein